MSLILLILAFVLFMLGAMGVSGRGVNLTAAGLAAWVASQLVGYIR